MNWLSVRELSLLPVHADDKHDLPLKYSKNSRCFIAINREQKYQSEPPNR